MRPVTSREMQKSIGSDAAIAMAETEWWKSKTPREIVEFQLFTVELACPFSVFHEAIEMSLGRGVLTHELALNIDGLCREFLGAAEPPTLNEIIEMIPEGQRILIIAQGE